MQTEIFWGLASIPSGMYAGGMIILQLLMIIISAAAIGWLLWNVGKCLTKSLLGKQTWGECFPGCCPDNK